MFTQAYYSTVNDKVASIITTITFGYRFN